MKRTLAYLFGFIGLFNIVAAIFRLVGSPDKGAMALGIFGLSMLFLGIGLCPCQKRETF